MAKKRVVKKSIGQHVGSDGEQKISIPNSAILPENPAGYNVALANAKDFLSRILSIHFDIVTNMELRPVVKAIEAHIIDLSKAIGGYIKAVSDAPEGEVVSVSLSSSEGEALLKNYSALRALSLELPIVKKISLELNKNEAKQMPKFSGHEHGFLREYLLEIVIVE